jgi:hypothetical protein
MVVAVIKGPCPSKLRLSISNITGHHIVLCQERKNHCKILCGRYISFFMMTIFSEVRQLLAAPG